MNTAIDLNAAQRLFAQLDQIHLVAIDPERKEPPQGRDFEGNINAALAWAAQQNGRGMNVYWTVNRVRPGVNKKPLKGDIVAARFAHIDIDPPKDGSQFDPMAITLALKSFVLPPSFIINSGNGLQAFWRLAADCTDLVRIETINAQLRNQFRGDACQNIDRLMRVPGFVNYPDAKKQAAGRIPRIAGWTV